MASQMNSTKHLQKSQCLPSKYSQKMQQSIFRTSFMRPVPSGTKTRQEYYKKRNYRPMSLMNTDVKFSNKILANQINSILKGSDFLTKQDLFQRFKHGSIAQINHYDMLRNKLKNKNHMIISIDEEKDFDKVQHPFMVQALNIVGIEGTYLNIIEAIHDNSEKLKAFSLISGTR